MAPANYVAMQPVADEGTAGIATLNTMISNIGALHGEIAKVHAAIRELQEMLTKTTHDMGVTSGRMMDGKIGEVKDRLAEATADRVPRWRRT